MNKRLHVNLAADREAMAGNQWCLSTMSTVSSLSCSFVHPQPPSPEDLAVICFTSGTTGTHVTATFKTLYNSHQLFISDEFYQI